LPIGLSPFFQLNLYHHHHQRAKLNKKEQKEETQSLGEDAAIELKYPYHPLQPFRPRQLKTCLMTDDLVIHALADPCYYLVTNKGFLCVTDQECMELLHIRNRRGFKGRLYDKYGRVVWLDPADGANETKEQTDEETKHKQMYRAHHAVCQVVCGNLFAITSKSLATTIVAQNTIESDSRQLFILLETVLRERMKNHQIYLALAHAMSLLSQKEYSDIKTIVSSTQAATSKQWKDLHPASRTPDQLQAMWRQVHIFFS
jgi:hypothetical protein